jgi:hypothetical protein
MEITRNAGTIPGEAVYAASIGARPVTNKLSRSSAALELI